jgi:hypothetical protein
VERPGTSIGRVFLTLLAVGCLASAPSCDGRSCKGWNGQCLQTSDCCGGIACTAGVCCQTAGGSCAGNGDCCFAEDCRSGRCCNWASGACASDSDCCAGSCVDGTCQLPAVGERCIFDLDCQRSGPNSDLYGLACGNGSCCAAAMYPCAADGSGCCPGLSCVNGSCSCRQPGESCHSALDCCTNGEDAACLAGTCCKPVASGCAQTSDCCPGLTCTGGQCLGGQPAGGSCQNQFVCVDQFALCEAGRCCNPLELGGCMQSSDCCQGTCVSERCCMPLGGRCAATLDCCSGPCVGGVCAAPDA